MRAAITGLGGFVGAHLAARLVADGWDVAGTIRPGGSRGRLAASGLAGAVHVVEADLSDAGATAAAARALEPDVAFLVAAARPAATPPQRAATAAVNGPSGMWFLDALPEKCRTVVRLGSSTEYGPLARPMTEETPLAPPSFFGATKAAGSLVVTAAARARGMRSIVIRPFQVYGPLDHPGRLVPTVLRAAGDGSVVPLTLPGRRRDWVFVDDVVECCVRAALADHLPPGQVLNVGTGRQVANEELVAAVEQVTGRQVAVDVGAHSGRDWDAPSWVCDPSRARQLLGWEAKTDLAEGLRRCWESM